MTHCLPACMNTLHSCNAVWDTLNPILHECNAPYMAMPIGNRYYTGAIWYAMYSCKPANNASLPYTNGCIAV